MGSYFGSSLCAVDLNQDGLSDLLVGAPMHSQLRDEGQVTVYLSKGNVSDICGTVSPRGLFEQCACSLTALRLFDRKGSSVCTRFVCRRFNRLWLPNPLNKVSTRCR